MSSRGAVVAHWIRLCTLNTLLKSDVTRRDHVVRSRGSQECGSRFVSFACKFHSRRHSLRSNSGIYNIGVHAQ